MTDTTDCDDLDNCLSDACADGDLMRIKRLLKDGADANSSRYYITAPAAEHGHLEVLKWLVLESGKKTDLRAEENIAMQAAIEGDQLSVVKWILTESGEHYKLAEIVALTRVAIAGKNQAITDWFFLESAVAARLRKLPEFTSTTQAYERSGKAEVCRLFEAAKSTHFGKLPSALETLQDKIAALESQITDLQRQLQKTRAKFNRRRQQCMKTERTTSLAYDSNFLAALQSPACCQAARDGFIQTVDDFNALLATSKVDNVTRRF